MNDLVFQYLIDYGFTKKELEKMLEFNDDLFFLHLPRIEEIIDSLEEFGLDREQVVSIINRNPVIFSSDRNRMNIINNILLNKLKMNEDDIYTLATTNPHTYTISPIKFEQMIDYLLAHKHTCDELKKLILANEKFISLDLEKLKNKAQKIKE